MLRFGLIVWAALFFVEAAASQTLYLQPGQHGISAAGSVARASGSRPWDEPASSVGASLAGTPYPGLDVALHMMWPLGDNPGRLRSTTGLVTGYLVNTEASKLGVYVGASRVTARYDQSASFVTGGLLVALPRPVAPGLTVVPQLSAGLTVADGAGAVGAAVSPALLWTSPDVRFVVEPSLGYQPGEEVLTMGVAVGLVFPL